MKNTLCSRLSLAAAILIAFPGCTGPDRTLLDCSFLPVESADDELPNCGYVGRDGGLVLLPETMAALRRRESDPAAAFVGTDLYYLNSAGRSAPVLLYDNGPDYFEEGLARTVRGGKIGFIDRSLAETIAPAWDFAFPFQHGLALVCNGCRSLPVDEEHSEVRGGDWGYIDREGAIVVPVRHERGRLPPARLVRGRELISTELPALGIRFDPKFAFLGSLSFRIRDVAAGERFVFVDAEGQSVKRLLVAQFEAMLPTSDETYKYSFAGAPTKAGYRFRQNSFAFSHAAALAENPSGEAALTVALLAEKGYNLEDEVMSIRSLTVPDSERRHELIIFYIEPLAPAGTRLAQLYENDEETPLWKSLAAELRIRAGDAFELFPLDSK